MKISIIAGTRPEVVKLAPVHAAFSAKPGMTAEWVATGQHGSLAEQAEAVFGITPDRKLQPDWNRKDLWSLTGALIDDLGAHYAQSRPDAVLVQGDTATAFSGAMAAFLANIPVGHVEAGLRSGDLAHPFPEEGFRKLIAPIGQMHFAPTRQAARNLKQDGVKDALIRLTGNTVIDAVQQVAALDRKPAVLDQVNDGERIILVTLHRRENWDEGVAGVCTAIRTLRNENPDVRIILPIHLNPRVRGPIEAALGNEDRIELIEPLAYPEFVAVMKRAYLILSDSGGVQEEAPSFGVPVLVLRDKTERQEAIRAGVAKLVGADAARILAAARPLLKSSRAHARMARRSNPFGDGKASERIVEAIALLLASQGQVNTPGASILPMMRTASA